MKYILKTFLTVALLLLCTVASSQSPVARYGQLQVRGTQLCDNKGRPVVLRGVSLGWHNLWPRFYNAKAVDELADKWHATVIRAAMGVKIEDNYLENPDFAMKCITPVIDEAIKKRRLRHNRLARPRYVHRQGRRLLWSHVGKIRKIS